MFVKIAMGYAALATVFCGVLIWLYLGKRDQVIEERERCNATIAASAAQASELARKAQKDADFAAINELRHQATQAEKARQIAENAAKQAQNRPAKVRTVIKEVSGENSCLDTPVPAAVLDSLRAD